MSRVLVLSSEPLRSVMAGMGIRCWEMARVLAQEGDVTLAVPGEISESPDPGRVRLASWDGGDLASLQRDADVVVALGHATDPLLDLGLERPLVVDLYDPFPIENLNYAGTLGREPFLRDRRTLERQLRAGDLFLCSSAEQRLFYLGLLFALGRLNPETYSDDPLLSNLIRVTPFGVPGRPPRSGPPVLRGVVSGIGDDDPVLLFGGVYEWHDPMTLLDAVDILLAEFPTLRVVFAASAHPDSTPQETLVAVTERARATGWLDRHVFVVPWFPYDDRERLYLESTIGVVTHHQRFETEVSMRTRVLDFLWAGLPVVVTEGGGVDRLLDHHGMGRSVPHGNADALATVVGDLLRSPDARHRIVDHGRRWAAEHTWDQVLAPLRDFVCEPRIDPHKDLYGVRASKTGGAGERRLSLPRLLRRLTRRA